MMGITARSSGWPAERLTEETVSSEPKWYAVWTHSRCEQLVYDQLAAKGFRLFFPKVNVWSRRGGLRHIIGVPMFPGYLFLREAIDKFSYIEILKARGVARVLGERWDRLAEIPEAEIAAIRKVLESRLGITAHPYLKEGQSVRITRGPLADIEGILFRINPQKGLLVVSIDLLQRSVAVEVDCTLAVPA